MSYGRWTVGFTACVISAAGCRSAPLLSRAESRRQQYLGTHRMVQSEVAAAIAAGHVVAGMDRDQVSAVLGRPLRKSSFARSHAEVWLYSGGLFHQDPMHSHGATLFRLVFVDQYLTAIDPL